MLRFLPTPIGNLDDISHRVLQALTACEVLICEDTRVSKSLISLLNQKFQLNIAPQHFFTLNSHNQAQFFNAFKPEFFEKNCVYLSDAGMPCVSDPGVELVKFAQQNGVAYEVFSGSNALLLAVAASGLIEKEFSFLGFLHEKNPARQLDISKAINSPFPCVIYESPRRVLTLVEEIFAALDGERRRIFLIKEATKLHESKFFGEVGEVLQTLRNANLSGEWVVVLDKSSSQIETSTLLPQDILELQIPPKLKAKLLSKLTGKNAKEIYSALIC